MKATLTNYRQTPRKVRLLADLVRGRSVEEALTQLSFSDKKASAPIIKLINSAVANAKAKGEQVGNLYIQEVSVNKGITFHRSMPRAFGRATPLRKMASHVRIVLAKR